MTAAVNFVSGAMRRGPSNPIVSPGVDDSDDEDDRVSYSSEAARRSHGAQSAQSESDDGYDDAGVDNPNWQAERARRRRG